MDIMRQSACLIVIPITVFSYGFLFYCTTIAYIVFQMSFYCKCPVDAQADLRLCCRLPHATKFGIL